MLGIRQKLSLGFGGLFLIILAIGFQSITLFTGLGRSIDVILRENYRSVLACQQMKEALERMDSGILFILLGETDRGRETIAANRSAFEKALGVELDNITLPGEKERAELIENLFKRYGATLDEMQDGVLPPGSSREAYFSRLFPLFQQIKDAADAILQMNQQNMLDANDRARITAEAAKRIMYLFLVCGAVLSIVFVFFAGRWILRPVDRLMRSTEEIRRGNLDLVVQSDSRDEIGRLSEAFNEMASSLRRLRRSDRTRMARIRRSTQQVFKGLPDAVAVVDLEGRVEVSTDTAAELFGLKPQALVQSLPFDWMGDLRDEALRRGRMAEAGQTTIQRFIKGEEHFFRPGAVPILDDERTPTGVILILKDITRELHQDELKRGVISVVSHQLKTPLTSIRMAVHLLLEEDTGPLGPKQVELLVAARDDSDRLHSILTNLLDISRIESGRMRMDLRPESPRALAFGRLESFRSLAKDRGIALKMEVPDDLPPVLADPDQIGHAFENLLSNAIKYTHPGGEVSIAAELDADTVRFSVSDTGRGIPRRYLDRVFDQFFRVPGHESEPGEGLGLAIAKEIVEAHGGAMTLRSEEGKGSVFSFRLKPAELPAGEDEST